MLNFCSVDYSVAFPKGIEKCMFKTRVTDLMIRIEEESRVVELVNTIETLGGSAGVSSGRTPRK